MSLSYLVLRSTIKHNLQMDLERHFLVGQKRTGSFFLFFKRIVPFDRPLFPVRSRCPAFENLYARLKTSAALVYLVKGYT